MSARSHLRGLAAFALLSLWGCGGLIAPDTEGDAGATKDAAAIVDGATDPCASVACSSPPADHCTDEKTARRYVPGGTCSFGDCGYSYTDYDCTYGCVDGKCSQPDGAPP